MSLAKLFYLKETFRESVRRWRQACFRTRFRARREQRFMLEALEPRVLLSGTPVQTALLEGADVQSPTVIGTSIPEGGYVQPGQPFTITVQFSEALATEGLGLEDVFVSGFVGGTPTSFTYNAANNSIELGFPGSVPNGEYHLELESTGFRDLDGNPLDGTPSHPLPSGDGVPGDRFVLNYHVDSYIGSFQSLAPSGSLIYEQSAVGVLEGTGDSEIWTVQLFPGQILTAVYESLDGTETGNVEVHDPFGNLVAGFSQGSPLQGLTAAQDGYYELHVISTDGAGRYRLNLLLSAFVEVNDADPGLDGGFITLDSMASRGAVVGTLSGSDLGDASDTYSVFLQAGQIATVVLDDGRPGNSSNLALTLADVGGTLLTTGLAGDSNSDQSIRNFVAPADSTYFINILGDAVTRYSVLVTKGTEFEREPNDTSLQAREIGQSGKVLGALSSPGSDDFDQYVVTVSEGDTLDIAVISQSLWLGNTLSPRVTLFDASSVPVATDENVDGDGQAGLTYTVPTGAGGRYRVVVERQAGTGEYLLSVNGATGGSSSFAVTGTIPSHGAVLGSFPFEYRVDLSEPLFLTSVQGGDLLINGLPQQFGWTIDADTVSFFLDGINHPDGLYTVALPAGVLTSISGKPNDAFAATFELDASGPRVTDSSIQEGAILAPGAVTYTVQFSEALATDGLGVEDITLVNNFTGLLVAPSSFAYDPGTRTATVGFTGVSEASWTMTLAGGASGFRDLRENPLDGAPSFPLPSGDGTPGGNFVLHFSTDVSTAPLPGFVPVSPEGARIFSNGLSGTFTSIGDLDNYTVDLDAGQTLTVRLVPSDPSIHGEIELRDATGTVASVTATAPGQAVLLQTAPITAGGTYTIGLKNLAGTGSYQATYVLNAALEPETFGGPSNDTRATAQNLDSSAITVLGSATRLATLGLTNGADDVFSFTLGTGEVATLVMTVRAADGTARTGAAAGLSLELQSADGMVLATGLGNAANIGGYIQDFVAPVGGTYYARVSGAADMRYTLVVTRNAGFEIDVASENAPIQDITLNGLVLGAASSSDRNTDAISVAVHASLSNWIIATSLTDQLLASPFNFVPAIVTGGQIDTSAELANYDVVVIGAATETDYALFSLALRNWVESGHGVVAAGPIIAAVGASAGTPNADINAIVPVDTSPAAAATFNPIVFVTNPTHPVTAGVSNFFTQSFVEYSTGGVDPGATVLALAAEQPAVVVGTPNEVGRAVFLAPYYMGDGFSPLLRFGEADQLLEQAVAWAAGNTRMDRYQLQANAGDILTIETMTPGDGPGQPGNTFDVHVELYDPQGIQVATNDNGAADGRNAKIVYTVPVSGTGAYQIRVLRTNDTTGDYLLRAAGSTVTAAQGPAPSVAAAAPGNGRIVIAPPTDLVITLSEAIQPGSVSASDLTIDGSAAVAGVDLVDGRTVRFLLTVPNLEQTFQYSLAAGAFLDLQGQGSTAFTDTFAIDHTGPRVVAQTPVTQAAPGFSEIAVTFDQPIAPESISAADIASFTGPGGTDLLSQITSVRLSSAQTITVRFNNQFTPGPYTLVLGPNITDVPGNRMDQNANGIAGEGGDTYTATVSLQSVDLQVQSITVPDAVVLGQSFTVGWTVRNIGTDPALNAWTDQLVLSTDAISSTDDVQLLVQPANAQPLAPGAEYTRQATITLDLASSIQAGTYHILVDANFSRTQPESIEMNNLLASNPFQVSVPPIPDLVVTDIVAPASTFSGPGLEISWTVANQGTAPASGLWQELIYLSTDNQVGNDEFLAGRFVSDTLAPGASIIRTQTIELPFDLNGTRWLIVKTDTGNEVIEREGEQNNVTIDDQPMAVTPVPLPDLVVTDIEAPVSTVSGQDVLITWTVTNQGTAPAVGPWSDQIWLSSDAQIGGDQGFQTTTFTDTLAPGASVTRTQAISLPVTLSGDRWVVIKTNALTNTTFPILEREPEPNDIAIDDRPMHIAFPPLPDLVVSNIVMPATAFAGEQIPITWTLTNEGAFPATGPWTDLVFLSDNPTIGQDQPITQFAFEGTLLPGASITRTQVMNLAYAVTGNRWLVVQTEASGHIFEGGGETNNVTIGDQPIVISPALLPDLRVASVTVPPDAFSSQETQVSWVVTNVGTAATSAPTWMDRVVLSTDTNLDPSDTFLGSAPNASYLAPGDSYANSLVVTLPKGIEGPYYFLVGADKRLNSSTDVGQVFELDHETDNVGSGGPVSVHLTPPPDLQVTSVNAPANAFSGQPMTLTWRVENLGTGPTLEDRWRDRIIMSEDAVLDSGDRTLGTVLHIGILTNGNGYDVTKTVELPVGISGDFFFFVEADAEDAVFEHLFEHNNDGHEAVATHVNLTPPPDLEVSLITIPATAQASHSLAIPYQVVNAGATATPASNGYWYDDFYLSSDAVFDPQTDLKLGERQHIGVLGAGQSYGDTPVFTLPNGLSGTFHLFVYTDRHDQVFELDNSNNQVEASHTIDIVSQPADLQVLSANLDRQTVLSGEQVRVTWTGINDSTGDTAVAAWTDQVIASRDGVLGGNDDVTLLQVVHQGLVSGGGTYTRSELVIIPPTFSGDYHVFVVLDASGSPTAVYESNDNNNASLPMVLTAQQETADLQVIALTAPSAAVAGDLLPLTWQVQNVDDTRSTTETSWLDAVWLSSDTVLSQNTDRLLGLVQRTNPLQPRVSYFVSKSLALPANLVPGNYFVIVQTDYAGSVLEAPSEDNNVRVSAQPVVVVAAPIPDLVLASVEAPIEAISGQQFELMWTVRNDGDATGTRPWDDVVYLSRDQILDRGFDLDVSVGSVQHLGGLNAGDEYTVTKSFTIPRGLTGPFYVFVISDALSRIAEGTSEENNVAYDAGAMLVSLAPPVDLVVGTPITLPANGTPGQQATITYTVRNEGLNAAIGKWSDSLYLSPDAQWDVSDAFFGKTQITGPLLSGGSYVGQVTAPLPGLTPGDYHVIVRSDILNNLPESDEVNNLKGSVDQVVLDTEVLQLGTAKSGTLGTGQAVYYRLDVLEGETIRIQFDSASATAANELYVLFGSVPTRGQFEVAGIKPFSPDQEVIIPETRAGTYYLLAYGDTVDSGVASYQIRADIVQFGLSAVDLPEVGNTGPVTLLVEGTKFRPETSFSLVDASGATIASTKQLLLDTTRVLVTFDLSAATVGQADLVAANGVETVVLPDATTIQAGEAGRLDIRLDAPQFVGSNGKAVWTVTYGNTGKTDIPIPLLVLQIPNALFVGLSPTGENLGEVVQILGLPGTPLFTALRPGDSASIPFHVLIGQETTSLLGSLDPITGQLADAPIDYDAILQSVPGGPTPAWQDYINELKAQRGETLAEFYASMLSELGQLVQDSSLYLSVRNINGQWNFTIPDILFGEPRPGIDEALLEPRSIGEFASSEVNDSLVPSDIDLTGGDGFRETHVLIVTVSEYSNMSGNKNIPQTRNDGTLVYNYFRHHLGHPNVKWLRDDIGDGKTLTEKEILDEIVLFISKSKIDNDDNFVFYFSGHGSRTLGDLVLNERGLVSGSTTRIDTLELAKKLNLLPTHNYIILDSCFAGLFTDAIGNFTDNFAGIDATDQATLASSNSRYGVFTNKFFNRLSSGGDHTVTVEGAFTHARDAIKKQYENEKKLEDRQTPYLNNPDKIDVQYPWEYDVTVTAEDIKIVSLVPFDLTVSKLTRIATSSDPNDIVGPAGFGPEQWVSAFDRLPYTIRFENQPAATAPAQVVTITQQLDSDLDWRTFRVGDFGWGDFFFDMPDGRSFVNERLDFTAQSGFLVDVSAGIDVRTGQAFWTITAIDPATGEVPTNPLIGFLPPNDSTHRGDGFVSYSVKARAAAQSGDVVDAQARIIFDVNEPIDTPAIFNTLDAAAPTSVVEALPVATNTAEFLVSWSGTDDEHGSAIHDYTIYVATNTGPHEVWLKETTLTASRFTGVGGNRYSFYSIARDNAGKAEGVPGLADATIVVVGLPGAIAGVSYADIDADGVHDQGEPGLAGRTIFLDANDNHVLDAGESSTTSGTDGTYAFNDLLADSYRVSQVLPTGWILTAPSGGTHTVNLVEGQTVTGVNFANFHTGSINGVKFHDLNANGTREVGEAALAGWTIFLDTNANGSLDSGELSVVTGADGVFSFTNLGPGTVQISEVVQAGWQRTTPAVPYQIESGFSVTADLGNVQLGSLSGVKFNDLNGDGVRDAGEPGIEAWTIFLDTNTNGLLDQGEALTVTDATGLFRFDNLLPGPYTVVEEQRAGWIQTKPLPSAVSAGLTTAGSDIALESLACSCGGTWATGTAVVGIDYGQMAIQAALETVGITDLRLQPGYADLDGRGVTTVVIDTGIDLDHEFFGADVDGNDMADRILYQWDFADGDPDASDVNGHGSHIASLIGSQDDLYRGVAPGTDLIVLKVFEDAGRGTFSYLEQALQWVVEYHDQYNVGVVNLSLGDSGNWTDEFSRYGIGDEFAALAQTDVIVVAAAGNNYLQFGRMGVAYPASDPAAIAVGATWAADFGGPWTVSTGATNYVTGEDQVAAFSQRDTSLLDTFAPGARFNGADANGGIRTMQGTSQAAAFVSGTAALAQQIAQETLGRGLSTAEFATLLRATGDRIMDGDNEIDNVTNTGLTFSRLNMPALAEAILALGTTPPDATGGSGTTGGTLGLSQPATAGAPGVHTVTLAAGDVAASLDFGNFQLGTLQGLVFEDGNGDGGQQVGEAGLAGWTVYLDANDNQVLDGTEQQTLSEAGGAYAFTDIGPGTYHVRVALPTDWTITAPAGGAHLVAMTSGLLAGALDFGVRLASAVNTPPVLNAIGDQSVDEDTELRVTISGSDGDVPTQPLTYSATGLPSGATFDPTTREFVWTPTEAQGPGSYPVTFAVSDGVVTTSEVVTITVGEVNLAPVLGAIGDRSVQVGQTLNVTVMATDADVPVNLLTLSTTTLPTGATFDVGTGLFSWTPTAGQLGDTSLTFTVTDNGTPPLSDSETITLRVTSATNQAPVVNDQTFSIAENSRNGTVVGTILTTDPNVGQTLSVALTGTAFAVNPTTGQITVANSALLNFETTPSFILTATVTDNGAPVMSDTAVITINLTNVNEAPVLTAIGNRSVNEGQLLQFTIGATDVDLPAQPLTYRAQGLPKGATFNATTRTFSWTPTEAQGPGSYPVTFSVTDGRLTTRETVTITVTEVNVAPVLEAIGEKTVAPGRTLKFSATGSDADLPKQTLTYSLAAVPGELYPTGITINASTGAVNWLTSASQPLGLYQVAVSVSDGALSATQIVTITVSQKLLALSLGTNDAPVITSEEVVPLLEEALHRWTPVVPEGHTILNGWSVQIAELEGLTLAEVWGTTIWLDGTAAGHGWFIDATPHDNGEFHFVRGLAEWMADGQSPACGKIDLLTTVMHEVGHVLGFDDQQASRPTTATLMTETLADGVRRSILTESVGAASIATSHPSNVPASGNMFGTMSSGFSLKNFLGSISADNNGVGTRTFKTSGVHPVIEWADEKSPTGPVRGSLGGVKTTSSWLSKFLSHTSTEERHAGHEIEVVLPGKK